MPSDASVRGVGDAGRTRRGEPIAVVVERFPSLSETFILNEIASLEEAGIEACVVTCVGRGAARLGTGVRAHVLHGPEVGVCGAPRVLGHALAAPRELARAALSVVPASPAGFRLALRALAVALRAAPELARRGVRHVHGHFLHLPGLAAKLVARRLGVSFSLSAHARDVFVPAVRFEQLCEGARFVAVCSEAARERLVASLSPGRADLVRHLPHGVAIGAAPEPRARAPHAPLRLLSVARAVPKKGLDLLLRALALLETKRFPYRCRIVGDGPESARLSALSRALRLGGVELLGALDPPAVRAELAWADVLVLACRLAQDGDRDGIPNAILEAMACAVPVVAGNAGGVPEVVRHLETGWLVPPDDPAAIAEALRHLGADEALRLALAARGRAEVERRFELRRNVEALARLLAPVAP